MTGPSLAQLHAQERRLCPRCGYAIMNPLTDRCPRCFETVARIETSCGDCLHQGACEFYQIQDIHSKTTKIQY